MCIALRAWGFSFIIVPSAALLLPMLETYVQVRNCNQVRKGGETGFVGPDPGLTDRSSWEALLGALGRCAEDRGRQDGDSCCGDAGSGSVAVVGRGAPARGGPSWTALELAGAGKWRLIPSRPAVRGARGNQKQLKIPDFPFYLVEGWGKRRGRGGQATGVQLHLFPLR